MRTSKIACASLLAVVGACSSQSQSQSQSQSSGPQPRPCAFSVQEDAARSYSFGVPEGWTAVANGSELWIAPDESGTSAAIVYTALLEDEHDARWFLNEYLDALGALFRAQGGDLQITAAEGVDDEGTVAFEGTLAGTPVTGTGSATVENRFVTSRVSWAPSDGSGPDDSTLDDVLACFQRTTTPSDEQLNRASATADSTTNQASSPQWGSLEDRTEGTFSFRAPGSWSAVANESGTISSLTLVAPANDAAVAFVFMTERNQPTDQMLISWIFDALQIDAEARPSSYSVPGARVYDFSGSVQGRTGQGMVAIRVDTYVTTYVSYMSIVVALPEIWESALPTLVAIAESSGKTDISGNLVSMPDIPNLSMGDAITGLAGSADYRDAVREKASDAWSEAMLGYVTVESPSTGQRWRASVNSYNPTYGGYVRQLPGGGGVEVLEQK